MANTRDIKKLISIYEEENVEGLEVKHDTLDGVVIRDTRPDDWREQSSVSMHTYDDGGCFIKVRLPDGTSMTIMTHSSGNTSIGVHPKDGSNLTKKKSDLGGGTVVTKICDGSQELLNIFQGGK